MYIFIFATCTVYSVMVPESDFFCGKYNPIKLRTYICHIIQWSGKMVMVLWEKSKLHNLNGSVHFANVLVHDLPFLLWVFTWDVTRCLQQ